MNDPLKISFKGWTDFDNPNFKDFSDEINNLKGPKKDALVKCMQSAESLLKKVLKEKGICFDGSYHQNGPYGTPVFEVAGEINGSYKWTATFRYWGGVMEACGLGGSYVDWAWSVPGDAKAKTPEDVVGENLIPFEPGYVADAYETEFDGFLGD
jgi:hypothetical protein